MNAHFIYAKLMIKTVYFKIKITGIFNFNKNIPLLSFNTAANFSVNIYIHKMYYKYEKNRDHSLP